MNHTDECIGLHTSCVTCEEQGSQELTICINDFGASEHCPKHEV